MTPAISGVTVTYSVYVLRGKFLALCEGKKKKVPLTSPILGQVLEAGLSVPTLKGTLGIGEAGDYRW